MANNARVRVVQRRHMKASGSTASSVLAMSNLDLMPQMVPVSLFCVYHEPSVGSFDDVVTVFDARLPPFLDHFGPLAAASWSTRAPGCPRCTATTKAPTWLSARSTWFWRA
jgi:hypothetical protein